MQLRNLIRTTSARSGGKTTHNKVTTRYCAKVASVVPRDWTAKATRIAQAIEALTFELVSRLEASAFDLAETHIKPAKKTKSK